MIRKILHWFGIHAWEAAYAGFCYGPVEIGRMCSICSKLEHYDYS